MRVVNRKSVTLWSIAVLGASSVVAPIGVQAAGDAAKGQTLAAKCISCHGSKGQGSPGTPALAGKTAEQLAAGLQAYKSGAKQHMMMNTVAKPLSDEDIANVAAYFAGLK